MIIPIFQMEKLRLRGITSSWWHSQGLAVLPTFWFRTLPTCPLGSKESRRHAGDPQRRVLSGASLSMERKGHWLSAYNTGEGTVAPTLGLTIVGCGTLSTPEAGPCHP